MANDNSSVKGFNWKIFFLSIVHWLHTFFVGTVARFLFRLYYGNGEKLPPIKDPILLAPATELALKIRQQELTSVQVVECFINRIKEVNHILNCVVADRFEDALKEAKTADDLIRSKSMTIDQFAKEKPLLGVPFTTKDCIPIKGLIHSSGLVKRRHNIATEDAKVVAACRAAGAIPLALTNVSELCMWWEGSNNVHGRTNNPYNTTRIVGGSSSGEGCAQGAALSAFGIGSDIGGSIRMPAFFNGVFGHKPSPGVVSNHGQYPEPVTEEQARFLGLGPICRKAGDLLPLLRIMADNSRLKLDSTVDVRKLRYFYQDSDGGSFLVSPVEDDIRALFPRIDAHLRQLGATVNRTKITGLRKSAALWFANMKSPNGPTFQDQLANLKGTISPGWELLKWCVGQSEHTLIALFTVFAERTGVRYGDDKHKKIVAERDALRNEISAMLGADGVFIYPTHPTAAPFHNEPLLRAFNFSYTAIVNCLGMPATHCPLGLDSEGLPIGVQVVASEGNDHLCLAVAEELERAFGGWVPPHTRQTVKS